MKYSVPTIEIEKLDTEDIILASPEDNTGTPGSGMGGDHELDRVSYEDEDPYASVLALR